VIERTWKLKSWEFRDALEDHHRSKFRDALGGRDRAKFDEYLEAVNLEAVF
jgi:hypothetical protein